MFGIGCLSAAFIPGQTPAWLGITATFAIGAAVFGGRWIRITGALLVVVSSVFVILEFKAARDLKEGMQEMQRLAQARAAKAAELRQKLLRISLADGISKPEAELIAECYFHENVSCGEFIGIQDYGGDVWVVDGLWGYARSPIRGFRIDKRTGSIRSPIGPSYATPIQIFGSSNKWNLPRLSSSFRGDK